MISFSQLVMNRVNLKKYINNFNLMTIDSRFMCSENIQNESLMFINQEKEYVQGLFKIDFVESVNLTNFGYEMNSFYSIFLFHQKLGLTFVLLAI